MPIHAQGRDEYIVISGGPALLQWESYRESRDRHDKWWGNFIRTARIRFDQLRNQLGEDALITWLVYRPGYARRATEEGRPLLSFIESVNEKYHTNLVWFDSGPDVINYLNGGRSRATTKISGLEYFGHSNKYCWVFDYSNFILGASKAWLHQDEFTNVRKDIFTRRPYVKSWGCHTAESMSERWHYYTKTRMIGAFGKTDYSDSWKNTLPYISTPGGYWDD